MKLSKAGRRKKIHLGIRQNIKGSAERPRLTVYRSNKSIYCQLIDDLAGVTLASASSTEKGMGGDGSKAEQAKKVGSAIADRAKSLNIEQVVFDRSGYRYHGRIKSLADGAREGGLVF